MADATPMLGKGMAKNAADDLRLQRVYQREKIDAQTDGRDVPEYDEWKRQYLDNQAKADLEIQAGYDSVRKRK
jgi:hypothetical protein